MRSITLLLALVACIAPLGCRSNDAAANDAVPCTCGQPMANMEGCAHPQCVHGERNPDNPDCVCGSLTIPK